MTNRTLARLAWSLAAFELLLMIGAAVLVTVDRHAALPEGAAPWPGSLVSALGFAPLALVGGLIAARLPRNVYGWLWLSMALGNGALQGFFTAYALHSGFVAPLPFQGLAVAIADLGWALGIATLPFLLLLYPTGRPASPAWRVVGWIAASAALVLLAVGWAPPRTGGVVPGVVSPFGVEGPFGAFAIRAMMLSVYVVFGCSLLGIVSLLLRFRTAVGVERQQLKWFAYAASVLGGVLLTQQFIGDPPGIWDPIVEVLGLMPVPVAVAVAMLRYRLYEIDLLIRRTLIWALLTGGLIATYASLVMLTQGAFRLFTGNDSQLAVVFSTLAVAAAFRPLRRRLQALIDRAFYRQRYDARSTLDRLSGALRTEVELEPLADAVLGAVRDSVQPSHASLWLRLPQTSRERP